MKKIIFAAAMALSALAASAQGKFAHVNFNEIVVLTPEYETASKQMDASAKEAQETYESMVQEAQAKFTEYQQKQSQWTPAIKESKEKELNDIQNRIQEFQQSIQQELAEQQSKLLSPIRQKVRDEIEKIAKAGAYSFVFDDSQFFYVDKATVKDLTADVKKSLGITKTIEEYQKEQEAKAQAEAQPAN